LSPEQRAAAQLCLLGQYSVEEAALALAVTPQVVKGRLQRARLGLRKEMSEIMPATRKEEAPLVLVIDDEHHICRLIQVNLELAGYRVTIAKDGVAGLAGAKRQTPDLVILDIMMPRMDGWEVLRHLRSERRTLLTPVLMLSALPPEDPRNGICHELADAYWQKPFSPFALIAWVDHRLGHLSAGHARQLLEWHRLRFSDELTPQKAAQHLTGTQYCRVQMEARVVLAEMGPAAISALAALLHSADHNAWHAAILLLAGRPEPEAVEAIVPLLAHPERERRWEALAALGQMGSRESLLALADSAAEVFAEVVAALDDPSDPWRASADGVLRRVRTPEAARLVRDHEVRVRAEVYAKAAKELPSKRGEDPGGQG